MDDEEQLISGRDFMRRESAHDEPGWVVLQADAGTAEVPVSTGADVDSVRQDDDTVIDQVGDEPAVRSARRSGGRGAAAALTAGLAAFVLRVRVAVLRGRGQVAGAARGRGLPVILGAGLVATAMVVGTLMLLGGGESESVPTSAQTATPSKAATPTPSAPASPSTPAAPVEQAKPARKPRRLPPLRATVKVTGDVDRVRVSIGASARGRVRWELSNKWGRVIDSRVLRPGTLSRAQFVVKKLDKGRYTWRVTPLGGGPVRAGRVVVKSPPPPPAPEPVAPVAPQPDPVPQPDPAPEPGNGGNNDGGGGGGNEQPPAPSPTPAPEPSDLPDPVES